ncbi:MAG TPA: DMT family transporter [Paenirhodobacter sp.]
MLATTLSFVGVNIIVHSIGTSIPTAQNAFLRFAWGWLFLAPAILTLARRRFPVRVWGLFGLRGAAHAVGVVLWFYAMARIPMADVTAIGYLTPIVVTLGGAFLLGEGFARRRGVAIAVALVGALIILRPGLREIQPGHLAELGAALAFGVAYIIAKGLTRHATAGDIVAMMTVCVTLFLAPVALMVWQPLSWSQLGWIGLTAAFATLGHYCMTRAFACAPVTVTQPVTFLQLIWATLAGWLLFGERIDPFVLLGGGLIITAISYMTLREAAVQRRITGGVIETKAQGRGV